MQKNIILLSLAVTVILSVISAAQAVVVSTSGGGIVLDSGGFEAETVGTAPSNPSVGSYSASTQFTTVTDAATAGIASNFGAKFVEIAEDQDGCTAVLAMTLDGLTSGTVHAEYGLYIPYQGSFDGLTSMVTGGGWGSNYGPWAGFANPSDAVSAMGLTASVPVGHAGIYYYESAWKIVTTGGGATDMSLPYDAWVNIEVDIDLDAMTFTLTIDGTTSDAMGSLIQATELNELWLQTNTGSGMDSQFFVDKTCEGEQYNLEVQSNLDNPNLAALLITPPPGTHSFCEGTWVDLEAQESYTDIGANLEYTFDHWEVDGDPNTNLIITVFMSEPNRIARVFYTTAFAVTYDLQIKVNDPNMEVFVVTPAVGIYTYLEGTTVDLQAQSEYYHPQSFLEYNFDRWEVNGNPFTEPNITVILNAHTVAEAIYTVTEPTVALTGRWELFIDDYVVSTRTDVTRTLHQPVKDPCNPVLTSSGDWEACPYLYGTVIYDEDESIYKMWYMSYNYGQPLPEERTPILYATSSDGINWEKPNLGLFDFNGSTNNNIVLTCYGYHDLYSPSVVEDKTTQDPNQLYKMIWWDYPEGPETYGDAGMCVAFSPDGIHWTKHANNPVLYAQKIENSISDCMDLMYDDRNDKFVAYTKGWADPWDPWPFYRLIVRTESEDFINWSVPHPVIRNAHDAIDPQSYGMPVSQYESVYLGLLRSYKLPGDQTIDIQLTISHDNLSWNRVANMATFLPLGPSGSWDDGMLFSSPLVVRGDTIEIFYGGWDGAHNSGSRCARIGVARLRKDGFVSLDAGSTTGIVTTKKLNRTCGDLFVNVNAAGGSLKVEVLDVEDNVLPGYSCNDCDPITTDSVNSLVTWNSDSQLPETAEPIRLRFVMENASLYSFQAGLYIDPPGSCGDACHPYPQGDLTGPGGVPDCLVNLFDFAKLAQEWMQPPADYDLEDLALLAQAWLEDNQP